MTTGKFIFFQNKRSEELLQVSMYIEMMFLVINMMYCKYIKQLAIKTLKKKSIQLI